MKVYHSSKEAKGKISKPVVAIGNFDGVHLGHKNVFQRVVQTAHEMEGTSVVYTLYPHPSRVIHPETLQSQINSIEERLKLIENCKINVTVIEDFNRAFSEISAEDFFNTIILKHLNPQVLYVGYNFHFGKSRHGDTKLLKKLCAKSQIHLHVVAPFKIKNEVVSSSKIREFVLEGQVKKAATFLGRPFSLHGITIKGDKRGKKLGFPTANMQTEAELIPKMGVYITFVEYKGKMLPGVTNVGHAPTFQQKSRLAIESHILDFKKDLYGETYTLHFLDRIRSTKKFPNPQALVEQIQKDVQTARDYFRHLMP